MSARATNGDEAPDTDPSVVREAARLVRDDVVLSRVDALIDLGREHDVRLGTLEGHARSLEGLMHGLLAAGDAHAQEQRSQMASLRGEVTRARRETEQRRIEGARVSSSSITVDAQSLGQSIESMHALMVGGFEGMKAPIATMQKSLGAAPNPDLGIEGSGALGRLFHIEREMRIAKAVGAGFVAICAALGSAAGLWKLFGGH